MVEIFTVGPGEDTAPIRHSTANVELSSPSDVYFGNAAPGIAFYEKSGADLKVTLLDGTETLIEDFFVIGPDGNYSRLLLGPNGTEEMSGLIAPEPLIPRDQPGVQTAEASTETQIIPEDTSAETMPETAPELQPGEREVVNVDWSPETGFDEATGQADGGTDGGMGLDMSSMDRYVVAGAGAGTLALLSQDMDSDEGGSLPAARAEAQPTEDSPEDAPAEDTVTDDAATENTEDQAPEVGMDPDLAHMINAMAAPGENAAPDSGALSGQSESTEADTAFATFMAPDAAAQPDAAMTSLFLGGDSLDLAAMEAPDSDMMDGLTGTDDVV